ncbi:MAG: hypothetical protein RR426_06915, partial [Oscillospiraceae bacterium]
SIQVFARLFSKSRRSLTPEDAAFEKAWRNFYVTQFRAFRFLPGFFQKAGVAPESHKKSPAGIAGGTLFCRGAFARSIAFCI